VGKGGKGRGLGRKGGGRYKTRPSGGAGGEGVDVRVWEGCGGGPWLTVPELLFEKKQLIPALQQLLVSYLRPTT
jgi:hypothetical protein